MEPPVSLFRNPPVVEVVLGVQFAPLLNFTSGHLGWFWRECLGREWPRVVDAPPLPNQFETFEKRHGTPPMFQVKLGAATRAPRLQISNQGGDRLIQVQQTRFIYNWQKKEGEAIYPSFTGMRAEFEGLFRYFHDFAVASDLGEVVPNQWEVTYVDQIPRGELWQTPADWHRVLPCLFGSCPGITGLTLEGASGEWEYEIPPARGRLHLAAQAGVTDSGEPTLLLQTTARGPIGKELDLSSGLDLGHDVARRAFLSITSPEAQTAWGRQS